MRKLTLSNGYYKKITEERKQTMINRDGIDEDLLKYHEELEKAFELGYEDFDEYLKDKEAEKEDAKQKTLEMLYGEK